MDIVRTSDERFLDLPGFDHPPHYVEDLPGYEGLRLHYIDVGGDKTDAPVFLCLHGEPTWAFLYRRMIPHFLGSGARVIAPDWFGFGRSDKPVDDNVYTFSFHRNSALAFIEQLNLRNITLVVQDWGGLLGLTLPMDMPERFSRLLIMNTALATGTSPGPGFVQWRSFVAANPDLDVGALMGRACPHLSAAEIAAYNAPFPDSRYKAGVRRFPQMVMTEPEMEGVDISRAALDFWRNDWEGQSFMAIGAQDPVLGIDVMQAMRSAIRNCPAPLILPDAGHFIQEWGGPVAEAALNSFTSK